jgi:hypothetical protein
LLDTLNAANLSGVSGGGIGGGMPRVDKDNAPVTMTPSLRVLQSTRATKTEKEVEEEFRQLATDKRGTTKAPAKEKPGKKLPEYESLDADLGGDGLGFGRERSKNLLLGSQVAVMNEVFQRLDKYDEGILRRSEFVMALRTDAKVIDFIDCEAVKKAYSVHTLTLDQVLLEIEKDERYDQANSGGGKKN